MAKNYKVVFKFFCVVLILYFMDGTQKIEAKAVYLDSLEPSQMAQYEGNQGDSFIYSLGKHQYTRGNEDVAGNIYIHGIEAWIARWNYTPELSWAFSVYNVNSHYEKITGRVVLIKSYNTTEFDSVLMFYGDGKLLKEYNLKPGSIPFNFSINIAGVKKLKIYVKDNIAVAGGTSFGLVNCKMEEVKKKNISKAKTSGIAKKYYYTGKKIEPSFQLIYKRKKLRAGKDYYVKYKNNKKKGKASIVIRGKGEFSGKKIIKFRIVKRPKLYFSSFKVQMCLVNKRNAQLKVKKNNISGKVKWKSSNSSIVSVDKKGRIKAKSRGTAIITASIKKTKTSCKVIVTDMATVTVNYPNFDFFDDWKTVVNNKESELVFGGTLFTMYDDKKIYTGNIIVKREIISYKTIDASISFMSPGHYRNVKLKLPNKVKYTLHRHNLSNNINDSNTGKLLVGLVEGNIVWTQECSCGLSSTISWKFPELPEKIQGEDVYVMNTTSSK